MAKQTLNNGDSGFDFRNKINENTTELYDTTVKKTGNETIGGVKTFTSAPILPDATAAQHPVTLVQGVLKTQIKQTTGTSETDVMSQKAVTAQVEALNDGKVNTTDVEQVRSQDTNKVTSSKLLDDELVALENAVDAKQNITDESLTTTNKTIVGAVNEVKKGNGDVALKMLKNYSSSLIYMGFAKVSDSTPTPTLSHTYIPTQDGIVFGKEVYNYTNKLLIGNGVDFDIVDIYNENVFVSSDVLPKFRKCIKSVKVEGFIEGFLYIKFLRRNGLRDGRLMHEMWLCQIIDNVRYDVAKFQVAGYSEPLPRPDGKVYDTIKLNGINNNVVAWVTLDWTEISDGESIDAANNYTYGHLTDMCMFQNKLSEKLQNRAANIITPASGAYADPSDMTWSVVKSHRNLDLWASVPMIDIDFRKQYFQHYVGKVFENGADNLTTEYTSDGLKFTNTSGGRITCHYKLPASFLAPSVNFGIRVRKTATNHRVGITLLNDSNNMLNCFNDLNGYGMKLTNKAAGVISDIAAAAAVTDDVYELHMNWGNSKAALYKTINEFTSFVGEGAISISGITTPGTFRLFRPAIYIDLQNNQSVTIERFSAGYSEGIGHADFRSVTYENGEPIFKDGMFFITASSRLMGTNGGSGLITVFSVDRLTFEVKPVSFICASKSSVLESGTAAKIVYDRDEKRWIYVARAFPSPGGKLHIGFTRENLIGSGLHIITVAEATQLAISSLDADMFKYRGTWYLGYHGGSPRTLRIAKSTDLINWTEIINQESGEGVSFARFNGKWFVVDARTPFDLGISEFNVDEETVTFLNNWTLPDNAGITGAVGGNPWGCIVPYWRGDRTEFYLVLFSRDEYIAGLADVFSYGSIWIYNSYQVWDGVSEFTQECDIHSFGN